MVTAPNWLDEVVILNESAVENVPGDISIHRSEGDALHRLEPWLIQNSEVYAFSATGVRLVLGLGPSGEMIVDRREECAEGPKIVLHWLQSLAQTTLAERVKLVEGGRAVLSRAEEEEALPTSVEGLLAYVDFPWLGPPASLPLGCWVSLAVIAVLLVLILMQLV